MSDDLVREDDQERRVGRTLLAVSRAPRARRLEAVPLVARPPDVKDLDGVVEAAVQAVAGTSQDLRAHAQLHERAKRCSPGTVGREGHAVRRDEALSVVDDRVARTYLSQKIVSRPSRQQKRAHEKERERTRWSLPSRRCTGWSLTAAAKLNMAGSPIDAPGYHAVERSESDGRCVHAASRVTAEVEAVGAASRADAGL